MTGTTLKLERGEAFTLQSVCDKQNRRVARPQSQIANHRLRARLLLTISALTTLALLLGGCTQTDAASATAFDAEKSLVSLMTDSAAQLPVGKWEPVGGRPAPGPCRGEDRARFSWSISAPRGTAPLADAKRIASYWSGLGMHTRLVEAPIPSVFATGGGVKGLSFVTGPSLYAVHGTSICADGESAALEDRPTVAPRTPLPETSPN